MYRLRPLLLLLIFATTFADETPVEDGLVFANEAPAAEELEGAEEVPLELDPVTVSGLGLSFEQEVALRCVSFARPIKLPAVTGVKTLTIGSVG